MASSPIVIAIAGATGNIGSRIARILLSKAYHPVKVGRVLAFTRNETSSAAQELKALGAEVKEGEITAEALKGVDVLINALGMSVTPEDDAKVAIAAADAGVKVYLPRAWGLDHYGRSELKHPIFDMIKAHRKMAAELNNGSLKVISLAPGPFMEFVFVNGVIVGLDTANGVYTAVGSPDVKLTFTSMDDIASTVAVISVMAAHDPNSVPDAVRISGDANTVNGLAKIVEKETGKVIQVKTVDAAEFEKTLQPENYPGYVQLAFGQGLVDQTANNFNEVVNPGESLWKWKKMEEYVRENRNQYSV